jgi:hypothetical protein
MNGTEPIYNSGEQAIISLTGLVFCPLVSLFIFYIAVVRRRAKENETLSSKAHLFYRMTSGIILGQVLNFTLWSVQLVPLFVSVGYFALEIVMSFLPEDRGNFGDVNLNKKTMEKESVFAFNNLTDESFVQGQLVMKKETQINPQRQFMLFITLFAFTLVCVSNGFYLVAHGPGVSILLCYVGNAVAMTIVICSCMIHAHYHVNEVKRNRILWWFGINLLWGPIIVFVGGGGVGVLSGVMQQSLAIDVIKSNAFTGIFGVSSGLLLRIHQYFHYYNHNEALDKRDTTVGLCVFALALAQAVVIGIYY